MADHDRDSDSPADSPTDVPLLDQDTLAFIGYTIDEAIRRYRQRRPLTMIESRAMGERPDNDNCSGSV